MKKQGRFFGLLSGSFWGFGTFILGLALSRLYDFGIKGSLTSTWLHDSFSFLILLIIIIFKGQVRYFFNILFSKSGLAIIIAALLGGPVGMGAYLLSIRFLGSSMAASISAIYPAVGALLAYWFLKEEISFRKILGLTISIVAIMTMSLGSSNKMDNQALGLLSVSITILAWGSEAVIISAALKEDVPAHLALGIRQMTSAIVYGLIILPLIGYESFIYSLNHSEIVVYIAFASILGTLSYLFYYSSIERIGASSAMALNITYPFWTFLAQVISSGQFLMVQFIQVLMILFGAFIGIEREK